MRIGLDFDGVISDSWRLKSIVAQKLYSVDIPPEKFKREIIVGEGLLTAYQYRRLKKIIYGTREGGLLMEPVVGALRYIPQLIENGHSLFVVTSRGAAELEIAKEWSQKQGLTLDFVGVGHGNNKLSATRGIDVYVDDDLDKLEPLVGEVPRLFLFSWAYNVHVEENGVARRVDSWEDLYSVLQTF